MLKCNDIVLSDLQGVPECFVLSLNKKKHLCVNVNAQSSMKRGVVMSLHSQITIKATAK